MSLLRRLTPAVLLLAVAAGTSQVLAADPEDIDTPTVPKSLPSEVSDRLFLSFAQEAALVPSQWWEAQIEYDDGSSDIPVDVFLVRGVVAFHPMRSLEVGGRVGFGKSTSSGPFDGTGATDLDAYAKWVWLDAGSNLDFSAGVLLTVPTGDDSAGLGFNSFAGQLFGGLRYRFDDFSIGGHVGVRANGDGKFQGFDLNGKTSVQLNVAAIFPLANNVSLSGEAQIESARFEDVETATEVLVGINWRAFGRGMFRGAVGAGLTDGVPDFRVLVGYAYTF